MKELEPKRIDKTEIENIVPIIKEKKFVASLKARPGQKTYQLDLTTMVITEAEYTNDFVTVTEFGGRRTRQIRIMDNCIYCVALNFKNADRRFHKMLKKPYKDKL